MFTELSHFGIVRQIPSRKRTLGPLSFMLKKGSKRQEEQGGEGVPTANRGLGRDTHVLNGKTLHCAHRFKDKEPPKDSRQRRGGNLQKSN